MPCYVFLLVLVVVVGLNTCNQMAWLFYVSFKETFQSTFSSLVNLVHWCQRPQGSFKNSWVLLSCPWSLLTHKAILHKGYAIIMQRRSLCHHCLLTQIQMMPLPRKFVSWVSGVAQPHAWKQNVASDTHLVWCTTWTAALYCVLCQEDEKSLSHNLICSSVQQRLKKSPLFPSTWMFPFVVVKKTLQSCLYWTE